MSRMTGLALVVAFMAAVFFTTGTLFEVPTPVRQVDTKTVYITEYINNTIEVPVGEIYDKNITVYGVAVFNDTSGGELVAIGLFLKPGYGGTLLDVSDKTFGADFQETFPLIRAYAEAFTGNSLAYRDIIIKVGSDAGNIGGSSGSAAIAIGLIAMIQNKELKEHTVITGVLRPDGTIGAVSSLDLKVSVAKTLNVQEILIPKVQCNSLNESVKEGISVVCTNTIKEALERMSA